MDYLITIISAIFALFLPGLAFSFALFRLGQIDVIERIALSFALSIATVPLLAFYLNLLGIPIRRETVAAETLIIILVGILIYSLRNKMTKKP